jgi:hypothetical protein
VGTAVLVGATVCVGEGVFVGVDVGVSVGVEVGVSVGVEVAEGDSCAIVILASAEAC